jgi:urease accessory protein
MAMATVTATDAKGRMLSAGSSTALVRLLQLVSPSFPVGAYAYSQGLEQAVERGWVADAETLSRWVRGILLHGFAQTDLALLLHAYAAWSAGDDVEARALSRLAIALRETAELRAEERQLGASLARMLKHLGVERAAPFVQSSDASYVVLLALAGHHFVVPPGDLAHGCAFAWAENQLLAATRLFALGQSQAQRVLMGIADAIPAATDLARKTPRAGIGCSAAGVCVASAWHEEQYSRLFRS